MKTYMFPGQGSQARGMGAGLFERFKDVTRAADDILGYSIEELCLNDPNGLLKQTRFTQPAMYVINELSYRAKVAAQRREPDYVIGHSLGEFNALRAAQCFDFDVGLRLVQKRGELMGQAIDGAMAAIVNVEPAEVLKRLHEAGFFEIDIANFNSPLQIVISGSSGDVAKAESLFSDGSARFCPLNVSGAFHSRRMRAAQQEFRAHLRGYAFEEPAIPVISNVTAKPYRRSELAGNLAAQMVSAVRWSESVQYLLNVSENSMEFDELGHGGVLTKLVHAIKQQTVLR